MKHELILKDAFNNDLRVSRILFGGSGAAFVQGRLSDEFFIEMISKGLYTLDMARLYGNGHAEEQLGDIMKRNPGMRENVTIISKCCHPALGIVSRLNARAAFKDIETTLKYLQCDHVDCLMLHRDDSTKDPRKVITFMNEIVKKGYTRTIGVSNWKAERIKIANDYALSHNMVPFTISEPQFSPGERVCDPWHNGTYTITGDKNEKEREFLIENHIPAFCFSSLGDGFFSGKNRSDDPEFKKKLTKWSRIAYYSDHNMEVLRRIEKLASQKQVSVATLSLAYCLNQKFDACCITSVSSMKRVEENLAAVQIELTEEEMKYLSLKD